MNNRRNRLVDERTSEFTRIFFKISLVLAVIAVFMLFGLALTACSENTTRSTFDSAISDFEVDPELTEVTPENQELLYRATICEIAGRLGNGTLAEFSSIDVELYLAATDELDSEDAASWFDDNCHGVPSYDEAFELVFIDVFNDMVVGEAVS
jgi:hypothetical protein